MDFTGHPTRVRAKHFPMEALKLVLAWANAGMAEPTEPLRGDLVYLPRFGDTDYCLISFKLGRGRTAPEPEHKVGTSDGMNLLLGHKPEDITGLVIHRDGEWISLAWESGYAPGNRSWSGVYEGPDEGAEHKHDLLQLILPYVSTHFREVAVTSYGARDASLLREHGFGLPENQSSAHSVIWWQQQS
jgi:hypothetical protein